MSSDRRWHARWGELTADAVDEPLAADRRDMAQWDSEDVVRILVIEDEAKTAAYLKKGLEENGFVVDLAQDGETGSKHCGTGARQKGTMASSHNSVVRTG